MKKMSHFSLAYSVSVFIYSIAILGHSSYEIQKIYNINRNSRMCKIRFSIDTYVGQSYA